MPAPSFVTEVLHAADAAGVDLVATGYAWARVSATVTLVPAFGLRALPSAARGALGVALALAIAPAVVVHQGALPGMGSSLTAAWPVLLLLEVLRGLPVALAAAIPLWGATMVGGVVDSLRGDSSQLTSPVIDGQTTSLGVLFSLLATSLFLAGGGAARVVMALAALDQDGAAGVATFSPLAMVGAIAHQLAAGLQMAVALAAPLLVAAVMVEVGGALIARAASPGQFQQILAPVRALALLGVLALVIGRLGELLARWSLAGLP